MLELLVFLALSSEISEIGVEVRHSWERLYIASRTTAIIRPEYGLQQQFVVGVAGRRVSLDVAIGGVYLDEPWPLEPVIGKRLNYALSTRLTWLATERLGVYAEYRHWSNGGEWLHKENDDRNPAHDALMVGMSCRF